MAGTEVSTSPSLLSRRDALVLAGAAAAGGRAVHAHVARAAAPFEIPSLPYAEDALAPTISPRTVGCITGSIPRAITPRSTNWPPASPMPTCRSRDRRRREEGRRHGHVQPVRPGLESRPLLGLFKGGAQKPDASFAKAVDQQFGSLDGLVKKWWRPATPCSARAGSGL